MYLCLEKCFKNVCLEHEMTLVFKQNQSHDYLKLEILGHRSAKGFNLPYVWLKIVKL